MPLLLAPLLVSTLGDINSLPLTLFEPSTGARCLDGSMGM